MFRIVMWGKVFNEAERKSLRKLCEIRNVVR